MKKCMYQKMTAAMEIPVDLSEEATLVKLLGQSEMHIENFLGILEYTQNRLLLQCKECRLEVCGAGLFIRTYAKEELVLRGRIEQIHYF